MNQHLRTTGAALSLAASLTAALTGCSSQAQPAAAAKATPALATTSPHPYRNGYCKDQAPFTGDAAKTYGADNVMAAYCEMAAFALDDGATNLMLSKPKYSPADFASIRAYMTPSAATEWDKDVAGAVKGQEKGKGEVEALTMFDLEHDGFRFPTRVATVTDKTARPATVGVVTDAGRRELAIEFTTTIDIHVLRDGKPVTVMMTRKNLYNLLPNESPNMPWLIDSWKVGTTPTIKAG